MGGMGYIPECRMMMAMMSRVEGLYITHIAKAMPRKGGGAALFVCPGPSALMSLRDLVPKRVGVRRCTHRVHRATALLRVPTVVGAC